MSIKEKTKSLINSLPSEVVLVGVTKYSKREDIEIAIEAGLKNIGENRVDSIEKIKGLNVKKHFIGPIQSNKIKKIVENFDIIHSVTSMKHLLKINKICSEISKTINVLLQLKISNDENKMGITLQDIDIFLAESSELNNIKILGFMMMASNTQDQEKIVFEFKQAKEIFDKNKQKYGLKYLSMGMSGDYELAIKNGSNMVRVGSKIFK